MIEPASLLVGAAAFVIIVLLSRTRIAPFSAVVALVVPTIIVVASGVDVDQVGDQGDIPRGVPLPAWPDWSVFSVPLITGARPPTTGRVTSPNRPMS